MSFDEHWNQPELELPEVEPNRCEYARRYRASILPVVEKALQTKNLVDINQAILLATRQYFAYRVTLPKSHRNHVSDQGHVCVFTELEHFYTRLRNAELSVAPPMLFLPAPPKPTPAPAPREPAPIQIAGVFFGEEE